MVVLYGHGCILTDYFRVSWVTLPAAVQYVRQRVKNTSPDEVLVPCLNKFTRRTTGAQHLLLILIRSTNESLLKHEMPFKGVSGHQHGPGAALGRKIAPAPAPTLSRCIEEGFNMQAGLDMARIKEAQILASVTKAIDVELELNC